MTPKLPLLDKIVLTPHEAAAIANCSPTTIYAAINDDRLPARKKGRMTVILRTDLDQYLQAMPRYQGRKKVV